MFNKFVIKVTIVALLSASVFIAAATASMGEHKKHLVTYIDRAPFYAGFATQVSDVFQVGKPLTIVREALNPYDPNLLALYDGGVKVGYIPPAAQGEVVKLLRTHKGLKARVIEVNPDYPWEGIRIAITKH